MAPRSRGAWISCAPPRTSANWSRSIAACRLYPDQPRYVLRAAEGVRTNMKAVFEAVAHRNPYPSEQLAGAGLEPDGAEGAVRRQPAWIRSSVSTAAPIRRWRACSATMRTNAGPRGGRSARNCGVASDRMPRGEMLADLGRVLETGHRAGARGRGAGAAPARPIRRQPGCYGHTRNSRSPCPKSKVSWQAIANPA